MEKFLWPKNREGNRYGKYSQHVMYLFPFFYFYSTIQGRSPMVSQSIATACYWSCCLQPLPPLIQKSTSKAPAEVPPHQHQYHCGQNKAPAPCPRAPEVSVTQSLLATGMNHFLLHFPHLTLSLRSQAPAWPACFHLPACAPVGPLTSLSSPHRSSLKSFRLLARAPFAWNFFLSPVYQHRVGD